MNWWIGGLKRVGKFVVNGLSLPLTENIFAVRLNKVKNKD